MVPDCKTQFWVQAPPSSEEIKHLRERFPCWCRNQSPQCKICPAVQQYVWLVQDAPTSAHIYLLSASFPVTTVIYFLSSRLPQLEFAIWIVTYPIWPVYPANQFHNTRFCSSKYLSRWLSTGSIKPWLVGEVLLGDVAQDHSLFFMFFACCLECRCSRLLGWWCCQWRW